MFLSLKTITMKNLSLLFCCLLWGMTINLNAQAIDDNPKYQGQLEFSGVYSQNEGSAAWNADGTGPEDAGTGHLVPAPGFSNLYYYGASRDFITGNVNEAFAQIHPTMTGFALFEQALVDNGFNPSQIKFKCGLGSLKADIENLDWFIIDDYHYSNHYDFDFFIECNGEPMLAGVLKFLNINIRLDASGSWFNETPYFPLHDVSNNSSSAVQSVAEAFLADLNGMNVKLSFNSSYAHSFQGNGRYGAFYNITDGIMKVGQPYFPFEGLTSNHQGIAGWNADGTGPEEEANGHGTGYYYGASLDYDGIDTNANAALGHFLPGAEGFVNTVLQLRNLGYFPEDLSLRLGLNSLGQDREFEDWGSNGLGNTWGNHYNNVITLCLDGMPVIEFLSDTIKLFYSAFNGYYNSKGSPGKAYDISDNATADSRLLAQSFLRDIGHLQPHFDIYKLTFNGLGFNGNGRDGVLLSVEEAAFCARSIKESFISEGTVSGNWGAANSPYYIDGDIIIENGQTLTIEPGVVVAARGPFEINVQGQVIAMGKSNNVIRFTHSNPIARWEGFKFNNTPTSNDSSMFGNCIFEYAQAFDNSPNNCGGMFFLRNVNKVKISNSLFRFNESKVTGSTHPSGGAIGMRCSSPVIEKCEFYNNHAMHGGAIYAQNFSFPLISNCLFHSNDAKKGGAMAFVSDAGGKLLNTTIADNTAQYGGGIYFYDNSNPEIVNSLIWGNTASLNGNQVHFLSTSTPGFFYCDVEGGKENFGGMYSGTYQFNVDDDPLFSYEDHHPYGILEGSPCVNIGSPDTSCHYYAALLPNTCLCGNPRLVDGVIDIGAYEYSSANTVSSIRLDDALLSTFPNPFSDKVQISFNLAESAEVSIRIFNSLGQQIEIFELGKLATGSYLHNWNAPALAAGIYIIKLKKGDALSSKKVIKK